MKKFLWLVGICILAWIIQTGIFFQTGYQWFQTCWTAQHSSNHSSQSAEDAVAWAKCRPAAQRALFEAGYVFSGNPEYAVTPELKAIVQACPSNYSTIPMDGVHLLAVDMIQQAGGPTFLDRFTPPSDMIVRTFNERWPNCSSVRAANGFPKIVMKNGEWGFAMPCKPCEAEIKAKNKY